MSAPKEPAPLSGQVAEDDRAIYEELTAHDHPEDYRDGLLAALFRAALFRLAAAAQEREALLADENWPPPAHAQKTLRALVALLEPEAKGLEGNKDVLGRVRRLLADNAALLKVLRRAAGDPLTADGCLWCENLPPRHRDRCLFDLTLEEPHPGAALLEDLKKKDEAIRVLVEALVYAEAYLDVGTMAARDIVREKIATLRSQGRLP